VDLSNEGGGKWKLFDALSFLRIEYAERWRYNCVSIVIAALATAAYWYAPNKPPLMGDLGLLKDLKDFVQVLFPFFVGALAAVATFHRKGLDDEVVGNPAYLGSKKLTRRQFVCYILGYCAVVSIVLFVGVILAKMIQPSVAATLPDLMPTLRAATIAVFSLGFAHLIVITLWGLYYLSNRLIR
jgi:hypothetical protein